MNRLPPHARALFQLLRATPSTPALDDAQWRALLALADRTQCTLHLHGATGLPPWIAEEVAGRFERNAARRARLRADYDALASALTRQGVEFVLLKGFTHETGFGIDGARRVQYDIDLLSADVRAAHAVLAAMGYVPHGARELSGVHDRPLVQPHTWTWRGDYFDPEMPIPVEIHHSVWDHTADRLPLPDAEAFWQRRTRTTLAEADRVAFAALHCLRHALHNDARPSHAFELARLLKTRAADDNLWQTWQTTQPEPARRLQLAGFRFAVEWFGGSLPSLLADEWAAMPEPVQQWFRASAFSPVLNLIEPNKDIVWLHRALVSGTANRLRIVAARLLPLKAPGPGGLRRLLYHARALAPALRTGLRRSAPLTSIAARDSSQY